MCLRRAPEKYIAGAALDRAGLDNVGSSTSQPHKPPRPLREITLFFLLLTKWKAWRHYASVQAVGFMRRSNDLLAVGDTCQSH
jgi:hypothetical protein